MKSERSKRKSNNSKKTETQVAAEAIEKATLATMMTKV